MGIKDALRKTYKIRRNVPGRDSVVVAMPFEVIEREARRLGLSVDEFIKTHQAVAEYDNFDGVRYTFQRANESEKSNRIPLDSSTKG